MFLTLILAVMLVDLLIPFFIAIPYKKYSHTQTVMSVLGCKASPLGRFYNVWMVVSGCTLTLFGYFIFDYYHENQYGLAVTLLVSFILYGIGDEVISGFFPLNEKKEDVTLSSKIHGIGSVVGFIALQFAPMILGILQFKNNQVTFGIYSIIFFILSLIAFIFFIIGEHSKFKNTIFALAGLWQRAMCALIYAPFIIWIIARL
ncbi:DUF998 domain-containing protein [Inediibacterium massiliense]|uniref:DUF998 domain-containing protein n=1 Tax=Inediibacterium massiliense TaxID=1658111 RepID=UPI0006B4B628|nr:DUF998 domain-containing protein [Inediibacterium massiliense]